MDDFGGDEELSTAIPMASPAGVAPLVSSGHLPPPRALCGFGMEDGLCNAAVLLITADNAPDARSALQAERPVREAQGP